MKKLLLLPLFLVCTQLTNAQTINWPLAIQENLISEEAQVNLCDGSITAFNSDDVSLNNKEYVLTFCPSDENERVFLENIDVSWIGINQNLEEFSLEVFDGQTVDHNLLANSTPENTDIEAVGSTINNNSGCLTIRLKTGTVQSIPGFPTPAYGFSLDVKCSASCQNIVPQLNLDASQNCYYLSNSIISINTGDEVTLQASAFDGNSVVNNFNYHWIIDDEEFEGNSITTVFNEVGIFQGQLIATNQYYCTSETLHFNLIINDDQLVVSSQDEIFTLHELVNDIMVGGGDCSNVENIQALVQSPEGSSIGYFSGACNNFPFDQGIVIGSGGVSGINGETGTENAWSEPSEEDEVNGPNEQVLSVVAGGSNSQNNVVDATVVEFEFTTFESNVSFDYIYASNEYTASFPCIYADPFAFILSGPGIEDENLYLSNGNPSNEELLDLGGLNMATITPNSTTIPVPTTATNIHPGPPIFNCNEGSLGDFFYPNFFNQMQPPYHSLNGETNILTANFDVIPCETYTLKLMVADWNDSAFNSYVFIEGGSFDIGINLGDDLSPNNEAIVCFGEEQTLNIYKNEIDGNCDLGIEWYLDGEILEEENNNQSIETTTPGLYEVFVSGTESCNGSDQVLVEFLPVAEFEYPFESICACSSSNQFEIDLLQELDPLSYLEHDGQGGIISQNVNSIADLGLEINFFESENEAIDFTNPIENPENYEVNSSTNQVWVRVNESLSGHRRCPAIIPMDLITASYDRPSFDEDQVQNLDGCNLFLEDDSIDLTINNADFMGVENGEEVNITYHTSRVDAVLKQNSIENAENFNIPSNLNQIQIYARIENSETDLCYTLSSFNVALNNVKVETLPLPNYYNCKEENQTSATLSFDLDLYNEVVLGEEQNPTDYTINYFKSESNGSEFINPIFNTSQFNSDGETLWVRISRKNQIDECFVIEEFELIVTEFGDPKCETFSTEDFQQSFNLYPNPTQGKLILDFNNQFEIQKIEVVNINGKSVFSSQQKLQEINLTEFSSGIYFVRILVNNHWVTKKIIKQ